MNRWVPIDHRYNQPGGLRGDARRPAFKWIGLLVAWVIVSGVLSITHLGLLLLLCTVGLICYCAYCILRDTPRAGQQKAAGQWTSERVADWQGRRQFNAPPGWRGRQQFNAPPGWPEPPLGWEPRPGWKPDRSWPPAPPGWEFWVSPDNGAGDHRTGRSYRTGRSHRDGT